MMKLGTAIKQIVAVDSERFRVSLSYTDGYSGTADLGLLFGTPKGKPLAVVWLAPMRSAELVAAEVAVAIGLTKFLISMISSTCYRDRRAARMVVSVRSEPRWNGAMPYSRTRSAASSIGWRCLLAASIWQPLP